MFASHREIIGAWPSLRAFGDDIGMKENAVKQMRRRNNIDWLHWDDVVMAAKRRKIRGISHELLKRLSPRRKRKPLFVHPTGCAA